MEKNSPLVLVDGSSYLFRAFHAAPNFQTKSGKITGTTYIFINMIKSLLKKHPSENTVVIFDAKGPTFRNDIYKEYKANRPPMPDELRSQIKPIHSIIKAMGLPIVSVEGVEADDVIGTLSKEASVNGQKVIISTGDKDMAQLVDDNITLLNTMKTDDSAYMDIAGVNEKFGVGPDLIIDYLALMGDKVDNIPGVMGIGTKTAESLISELGSINDIYENIDKVLALKIRGAKSVHKKLTDGEENARMSYLLATIDTELKLDLAEEDLKVSKQNDSELVKLFTEFEFNKWLAEMAGEKITDDDFTQTYDDFEFTVIESKEELQAIKDIIAKQEVVSLDFITSTADRSTKITEIEGVGLSISDKTYFININETLTFNDFSLELKSILENKSIEIIGESIKYENFFLKHEGINTSSMISVEVESSIVNQGKSNHYLDAIYPNEIPDAKSILGTGKKKKTVADSKSEEIGIIPAVRSKLALKFHQEKLSGLNETQLKLLNEIDTPIVSVLSNIEANGAYLDVELLAKIDSEIKEKQDLLAEKIYKIAGEKFTISKNNNATRDILQNKLNLPGKVKKGKFSLAAKDLETLKEKGYEIAGLIIDYNSLATIRNSYSNKLHLQVNPKTNRIHTNYNQAVVNTGRLSSKDPNLQGIPIKTEDGRKIRTAFCAQHGYVIAAFDYSQIELRILAHLSKDDALLRAFNEGVDIHASTASEINGVALNEVTDAMRRGAKAINFGLIYGQTAHGLAEELDISHYEAQKYIDIYFERYEGADKFLRSMKEDVLTNCEVTTMFGRVFKFPDVKSNRPMIKNAAIRSAINSPFQGTAADIIKVAMIKIDEWIQSLDNDCVKMIMQVHDELVFEIKEEFADEASTKIKEIMENSTRLDVPLIVDVGVGKNWLEAH